MTINDRVNQKIIRCQQSENQTINLGYNNLGNAGKDLSQLNLDKLVRLRELLLYNNNLGSAGEYLSQLNLGKLVRLQSLYLDRNNLGSAGEHLSQLNLDKLVRLQRLNPEVSRHI